MENTSPNHKKLRAEYKLARKPAGIFMLRNKANGKILLGSSFNLHGPLNRLKFELATGMHKNRELQEDWNRLGAGQFSFEIVDSFLPKDDPAFDISAELAVLEELWLEKLQPFGDKGYNDSPNIRQA